MLRYLGAAMIVFGCGFAGMQLAALYIREEKMLLQLYQMLQRMHCELKMRKTGLYTLFLQVGSMTDGELSKFFMTLSSKLQDRNETDVSNCVSASLRECSIPPAVQSILISLGHTLGAFDLEGQLQQLESISDQCRIYWDEHRINLHARTRLFRTVGLCTGLVIAIILI